MPAPLPYQASDFPHSPMLVFYETTRACNLLCKHCRATAQRHRHPLELSEGQALALIDQLATFPRPPLLVLTGGDPIKRPDVYDMVRHATEAGIEVAPPLQRAAQLSKDVHDVIRVLADSELTTAEIARRANCSHQTATRCRKKFRTRAA